VAWGWQAYSHSIRGFTKDGCPVIAENSQENDMFNGWRRHASGLTNTKTNTKTKLQLTLWKDLEDLL
jgi:ribosome modulation factor